MALDFVLACLVTWRVSSLLVREEGPYDLLARARRALGGSSIGRALECFYCTSLWVAAPVALWLVGVSRSWTVTWLALSGAAILAERATAPRDPPALEAMELDEAIAAMNARRQ
jgi:hypothetical protein